MVVAAAVVAVVAAVTVFRALNNAEFRFLWGVPGIADQAMLRFLREAHREG